MNTTIDFKTAKTIENMSRKIDGMERAVSGFFNKMSDIAERKYGDPQVYLAAVGPARDLSAILLEEAPGILPCFDETDDTFGISKELPVAGCYNPKQGFSPAVSISLVRIGENTTVASPVPDAQIPSASPRCAWNQRAIRIETGTMDPRPQLIPAAAPAR